MGEADQMALAERQVAEVLTTLDGGADEPVGALLSRVYDLLRRTAQRMMESERAGHTLTPTALVHEAYLRVADRRSGFEGRRHFYNAAAQAMRRILVEHARSRRSVKRGGGAAAAVHIDLSLSPAPLTLDRIDWLALDEALDALSRRDPRRHQVVMLRFMAGLSEPEIAELLGIEERTVRRDWATAKLWLHAQLSGA